MKKSNIPLGVHTLGNMIGSSDTQSGDADGPWFRAVPEPYSGGRLRAAWWVLTGKAHAVIWPDHGELEKALRR